jgi:hypothetical protein
VLNLKMMVAPAQSHIYSKAVPLIFPLLDAQPFIYPEPHPVVGEDGEAICTSLEPGVALEAAGEAIGWHTWAW